MGISPHLLAGGPCEAAGDRHIAPGRLQGEPSVRLHFFTSVHQKVLLSHLADDTAERLG